MSLREIAQALVDGPWRHAAAAREACRNQSWEHFVARTAPEVLGCRGWLERRRCVRRAAAAFSGPREVTVALYPIWAGDNPDEEASTETWYTGHAWSVDGAALSILETGPRSADADRALDRLVRCRALSWEVANVVECRSWAPGIDLLVRGRVFGVLAGQVIEILEAAHGDEAEYRAGAARPVVRPSLLVPPFACWFEPRVTNLGEHVVAALRELDVTVDDEGNLVGREGR